MRLKPGVRFCIFDEVNAAFVAVDAGEPVMMKHILAAAKTEYVKLEQALTDGQLLMCYQTLYIHALTLRQLFDLRKPAVPG